MNRSKLGDAMWSPFILTINTNIMDEDNDIELEELRWEYAQETRRDISRHRGLIDFDIDYEEEDNDDV